MIDGKRVLAVVPARGGSKGLVNKNLRTVAGIPLVALAGRVAGRVAAIDRAVVSTDSDDIARVAEDAGLAAPFRRPADLSGDRIGDVDVLVHALTTMEERDGGRYDIIVMLQPTSPLRVPDEVQSSIELLASTGADSVWTVSPADIKYHPLKALRVDEGRLTYNDPRGATIIARQQLEPLYYRNGVAYVLSRKCLLEDRVLMGARSFARVTSRPHISIDTADDLVKADEQAARLGLLD